jgi:hypothetical protein
VVVGVAGLGNNKCCFVGIGTVTELEYIFFRRISWIAFFIFKREVDDKKIGCGFCVRQPRICPRDLLVSQRPANLGHLPGIAGEKIGDLRGYWLTMEVCTSC